MLRLVTADRRPTDSPALPPELEFIERAWWAATDEGRRAIYWAVVGVSTYGRPRLTDSDGGPTGSPSDV